MKNELLSIGEMAKLKGVGIKALRYYEKIGLLLPAYVDELSGYRYYDLNQSAEIDIITTCVELGIPLKEVIEYRMEDGSIDMKSLLLFGKERAHGKLKHLKKREIQIESYLKGMSERDSLAQEISGSQFLVASLQNEDFNIKEYIKNTTLLFQKAEEHGLTSLYLEGIIFDSREKKLLCAVEIDNAKTARKEGFDTYIYPQGNYQRDVIKENSLKTCFKTVISKIENENITGAPTSAFAVWQDRHKREISAVDAIFPDLTHSLV